MARKSSRPDAPHQDVLLGAGFLKIGAWALQKDALILGGDVPAKSATYAVIVNEYVQYIGSSTGRGLKRRMYFYGKPGKGQRTSLRINALIKERLLAGDAVELIAAFPPPTTWNELPVDVVMGLELGLIKKFCPPPGTCAERAGNRLRKARSNCVAAALGWTPETPPSMRD